MSMKTTVVVQFGTAADSTAVVRIELDDVANLDAEGKPTTTFHHGDNPVFLVHYDHALLTVGTVECSSGMVQATGEVSREREQQISFIDIETAQSLDYITSSIPGFNWYGNDAAPAITGRELKPEGVVPAICDAKLVASFDQFRLIPPPVVLAEDEEWPILIVITMEAA